MPLPIISVAQMREWEKATWAIGQTEETVMRRAGAAVAGKARQLTQPGDFVLVLAGQGNNGGDARFAAEALRNREVVLVNADHPREALERLNALLPPEAAEHAVNPLFPRAPALIVDGLFGIGLNRPLEGDWITLVKRVNSSGLPVLAVDAPSGLDADTGQPMGAAIRADVTLTFGVPKAGLVQTKAAPFVGRLEVADDIGLIPCPCTSGLGWTVPEDFVGFPPRRQVESHKGTYGHLAILAGTVGYHGAAVLSTRGALRAQPGLVTLFTDADVYVPVAAQVQAAMIQPWDADLLLPENTTAVLAGPGLASPTVTAKEHKFVLQLWHESPLPMIVDASALDWLLRDPHAPENALRVIAPHPGEAARLLKMTVPEVQADRIAGVRELSRRFGNCWVVLKGHQTLIGRNTGPIRVNSTGNPHMAQGGSGDVLAGFIAGLLAQSALQADPLTTLSYAVWEHGRAGDKLQASDSGWTTEDLAKVIGGSRWVRSEMERAGSSNLER